MALRRPRIGLFGGTFDPPHVGHLVTAVNVRHALGLDTVILMVANIPWQKQGERAITPAVDRLAMVEAAVADVPGLSAGRLEIDAGGPSYTADTLALLARRYPGAELFTIVGDDAAAGLHTWERFEEVIAQSSLVVVDRPGEAVQLPDDVPWIHVEVPHLEVSSTDLRARFNDGRPLDYLVTDSVLDVIERRGCTRWSPAGMTVSRHRRRMTTTRAIIASLVGLAIAAGVGVAGYVAIANTTDGEVVGGGTPEVTFPATPTATLAVVDDAGDLASLAVFAIRPGDDTDDRSGGIGRPRTDQRRLLGRFRRPNARRSTRPWRCSGPSRSPRRFRSCSASGSTS